MMIAVTHYNEGLTLVNTDQIVEVVPVSGQRWNAAIQVTQKTPSGDHWIRVREPVDMIKKMMMMTP